MKLNEQQRIFLTVALCTGIWLFWQLTFGEPAERPEGPAAVAGEQAAAPSASAGSSAAPAAPAAVTAPSPAPAREAPRAAEEHRTFAAERYVGSVADGDVHFSHLVLPAFAAFSSLSEEAAAASPARGEALVAPGIGRQAELAVWVGDETVPLSFASAEVAGHFVFRGRSSRGLEVEVRLQPDRERYVWHYQISANNASKEATTVSLGLTLALPHASLSSAKQEGRSRLAAWAGQPATMVDGVFGEQGKLLRTGKLSGANSRQVAQAAWAGLELPYFLLAWLPSADAHHGATFAALDRAGLLADRAADANGLVLRITQQVGVVAPGQAATTGFDLYAGPKRDAELGAVDARLDAVVDYNLLGVPLGFLARPMMASLRLFYQWTHSWGVAIILLTLLVKALLLPANLKSGANIKRMQRLKPELDALSARYKGDPQRLQSEQMALYRKHQINPASGCLPLLLQIPVWLTLYRSLASAVDLYRQPFLWLQDLTATEPVPVLALAAGAATIVQQRLTPMATDSQQAKVMAWVLPGVVTVFMVNMPAGLTLYILVNSILTLLQQVVINRRSA